MGQLDFFNRHKMKTFVVFAMALAAAQALNYDQEWEIFKAKYERNYLSTPEHDNRKSVFISNYKLIQRHNAEHALGLHTYTLGVNQFADLTSDEFVKTYNGFRPDMYKNLPVANFQATADEPDSIDWRDEGYVTPVKNQGQCGSCWAFSAVATMEGAWFKKSGNLVSLSEQQLMDCDHKDMACNGGLPKQAIDYVIEQGGLDTEASYPYAGRKHSSCKYEEANKGASISKVTQVQSSEAALKTATATVGPISVGIDASHFSFQLYSGGVYHSIFCSSTRLDHGVAVVGYGSEGGKDYWIVKNSWGGAWGEQGYIKMSRNRNNNCGIATMAVYAVA